MSEATNRMDLNMLAEAVNLSPNDAILQVQELAKAGFLGKVASGYGVTENGKNAVKVFTSVPSGMGFNFYVDVGKPLGFSAVSLEEFYRQVKQVCSDSLEFHLYRGDFERWLGAVVKDSELAEQIGQLKSAELKGEDLRKAMLKAIDAKYGVDEML